MKDEEKNMFFFFAFIITTSKGGLIFITLATLAIQTAFFVSLRMLQKEEENLLSIGL